MPGSRRLRRQQPAVEGLVVLVRVADHERGRRQAAARRRAGDTVVRSLRSPGSVTTNSPGRAPGSHVDARRLERRPDDVASRARSPPAGRRRARRRSRGTAAHGATVADRHRRRPDRAAGDRGTRSATRAGVDVEQRVGGRVPAEPAAWPTAARAMRRAGAASSQQSRAARRPSRRVVPVDEQAGHAVADRRRQAADRGGDDRRAAGLGLDGDQAERLAVGRHDDEVGRAVPVGERRPRRPAGRTGRRPRCPEPAARSCSCVGAAPGRCRSGRRGRRPSAARASPGRAASSRAAARSSTSGP